MKAGDAGAVDSLYWVQFESFLPASEGAYDYRGRVVQIGGLDFICDTRAYASYAAANREPQSDGAYAQRLLERHGYEFPRAAVRLRAIHLPTPDRRSELMIIYAASLNATDPPEEGALLADDSKLAEATFRDTVSGMRIARP